jgi:hypothetical protein
MQINKLQFRSISTQYFGLPIKPNGGPRFEFAMYCGKPAIIRSVDKVLIARFVSPTDRPTILSFLALLNRAHFEECTNFSIVTKLSETKQQRLDNIRAIHQNIKRGIFFKERDNSLHGYADLTDEQFWAMMKKSIGSATFDAEGALRKRYGEKNYYSPFINRKK